MRLVHGSTLAAALVMFIPGVVSARSNGSLTLRRWRRHLRPGLGWKIDANAEKAGQTVKDAKLVQEGDVLHVTDGPSDYLLESGQQGDGRLHGESDVHRAEIHEPEQPPTPVRHCRRRQRYGNRSQSYLYCAAYGNRNFIVRGFGPEPFQMNGKRGEANPAVHKAAGPGEPVTQEIAVSVKGDPSGVRDQRYGCCGLR